MSKNKSIIVYCLGFLILTISNAYSAATYFSLNNKEEICHAVEMGKISFPYRTDTPQSYEKLFIDAEPFIKWSSGNIGAPPEKPNATQNQTWLSSPRTINVSSIGAERICYIVNTTISIGSGPSDPETPRTPTENDVCFDRFSIDLILEANPGEYKKYKYNFRARNGEGWSDEAIYLYGLDRRPLVVGAVMVDPASGQIDGTSLTFRVRAQNATQIRYKTIQRVSSSGEPSDPDPNDLPDPRNANAGVISGSSGTLTLQTNTGNHKKIIIRFVGFNENNPVEKQYGEVSGVYAYSLKGSTVKTGNVSVDPSGGSFSSHQDVRVSSENSTRIYYTFTLNDQEPQDPEFSSNRGMGPTGVITIPAEPGKTSTVKMKFRGYNEQSDQWGPVSKTYSYTINLSDSPAPPQPTPPPGKQECENQGGIWLETFGKGFCTNIGQNPQPNGSFKIMIEPSEARDNGAKWRRQGQQQWRTHGEVEENVSQGTHTVEFSDIQKWQKPAPISINVQADKTSEATVKYSEKIQSGLTLYLEPQQAFEDGARWGLTRFDMRESGDTIELSPGTYELIFEDIDGWIAPTNIRVEMIEDVPRNMILYYKRPQNLSYGERIPSEVIQKSNHRLDNAFRNPENGRIELDLPLIEGQTLKYFMKSLLSQVPEISLDLREKEGELHIYFNNNTHSLVLKLITSGVYTTFEPDEIRIDKRGDWLFIYDGIAVILSPVWADLSVRDFLEKQLSSKIKQQLVFIPQNSNGKDMVFKFDFEYQDSSVQPKSVMDENECFLQVSTEAGKQQTFIPFIHDFDSFEKLLNDYGLRARVLPYPHPGQVEILTHDYQLIYKGSPDCRINYNQASERATLDILKDQNNDGMFEIVFISPMGSQIIYSTR